MQNSCFIKNTQIQNHKILPKYSPKCSCSVSSTALDIVHLCLSDGHDIIVHFSFNFYFPNYLLICASFHMFIVHFNSPILDFFLFLLPIFSWVALFFLIYKITSYTALYKESLQYFLSVTHITNIFLFCDFSFDSYSAFC